MKIAAITDIGSCRQENQDNYCAQQLAGGTAWGIVCDGMGGVNGGAHCCPHCYGHHAAVFCPPPQGFAAGAGKELHHARL